MAEKENLEKELDKEYAIYLKYPAAHIFKYRKLLQEAKEKYSDVLRDNLGRHKIVE